MEPSQYKRASALLREVAYVLRQLLFLVPLLERLLRNWQRGRRTRELHDLKEGTGQVNPTEETVDER